jgi:hypothetical protein
LKNNKACGGDLILNEILKHALNPACSSHIKPEYSKYVWSLLFKMQVNNIYTCIEVENCIVYLLIIAKLLILLEEYAYGKNCWNVPLMAKCLRL